MDPSTPASDEPRDGTGRFRPGTSGNPRGRPRRDPAQAALLALLTRARANGGRITVTFDVPRAA